MLLGIRLSEKKRSPGNRVAGWAGGELEVDSITHVLLFQIGPGIPRRMKSLP